MSETQVTAEPSAEQEQKRGPGRPRKPSSDTLTVSRDELAEMIANAVKAALPQQQSGPNRASIDANGVFVGAPRNGLPVPPHTIPPDGWEVIVLTNGTGEMWRMPDPNFNNRSKADLLRAIDSAWADILKPVVDYPDGRYAMTLRVNEKFHEVLPSTKTNRVWGDHGTNIVTDPSLPNDRPLFALDDLRKIVKGNG